MSRGFGSPQGDDGIGALLDERHVVATLLHVVSHSQGLLKNNGMYSTFKKSDTNSIILIQPYFGLMKVRAMRSILQPNLIFKGAFGGLSKNMVSATT